MNALAPVYSIVAVLVGWCEVDLENKLGRCDGGSRACPSVALSSCIGVSMSCARACSSATALAVPYVDDTLKDPTGL